MAGTKRTVELPGFFDLQVNGFAGVDFGDAALTSERVLEAVAAIGKTGVTRFLPTLITSSLETFTTCARTIARTPPTRPSPGSTGRDPTSRPRTDRAARTPARSSAAPTWTTSAGARMPPTA